MDIYGPITPISYKQEKYIIFFLDSNTRYLDYKFIQTKSQAYKAFIIYKNKVEKQSNNKIKIIKSDNGLEFKNYKFQNLCNKEGIIQQFNSPYTYKQNGLIERINRTIIESSKALLFTSKIPLKYQNLAIKTAIYIYNFTLYTNL